MILAVVKKIFFTKLSHRLQIVGFTEVSAATILGDLDRKGFPNKEKDFEN